MKFTVLVLSFCATVSAFAADTLDEELQRASAQVAAIEPLKAPEFTRRHTAGLCEHGVTRAVTVNYTVSPAPHTTTDTLQTTIAKLFHDQGWLDGMPEGFSATSTDIHGVVTYPVAFRATVERTPKTYSIHHAYMWIGDKSIRCTYVFRYTK